MKAKTIKEKEFKIEEVEKVFNKLHAMLGGKDIDVTVLDKENIHADGFFAILIAKKGSIVSSQQIGKKIPAVVVADTLLQILSSFGHNVGIAMEKDKRIGRA